MHLILLSLESTASARGVIDTGGRSGNFLYDLPNCESPGAFFITMEEMHLLSAIAIVSANRRRGRRNVIALIVLATHIYHLAKITVRLRGAFFATLSSRMVRTRSGLLSSAIPI